MAKKRPLRPMDVAMATKVSVAPGIAPGSALNTGGAPKMSIESPPRSGSDAAVRPFY